LLSLPNGSNPTARILSVPMKLIKHVCLIFCFLITGLSSVSGQGTLKATYTGTDQAAKDFIENEQLTEMFTDVIMAKQYIRGTLASLRNMGFLSASLDSFHFDSTSIQSIIYIGEKYNWATLSFNETAINWLEETSIDRGIIEGKAVTPKTYQTLITKLLSYAENNGYPFASVQLDSLELSDKSAISAHMLVYKNRYFQFDTLSVVGDAKISKTFLYQYLGFSPDEPYSEKVVLKLREKLSKLPFCTMVSNPRIYFVGNRVRISLNLKHRKTDQADGIVGFAPNTTGENTLLVTGEVNLGLQNLLARGIGYELHWKSFAARSQQLKMNGQVPFLLRSPLGIDGNFEYVKFDTQFFTLKSKFGLQYLFDGTDYLKIYVQNNQSALITVDTSSIRVSKVIPIRNPVRTTSYGIQIQRKRLDNPVNPRKGFQLDIDGNVGSRNVMKDLRISQVLFMNSSSESYNVYDSIELKSLQAEFSYDASFFIPIGKKSTAVGLVSGKQLLTQNVFVNDLYRLGGTKTLRGFNEESLIANSYTLLGLEYRYLLGENAFFQVFANAAYTENKSDPEKGIITDTPYGFGVGVHLDVNAGILSLAYALGSEQGNGIKFNQAKIHFGIINYL
jgi:translocation and assembly module TamA